MHAGFRASGLGFGVADFGIEATIPQPPPPGPFPNKREHKKAIRLMI